MKETETQTEYQIRVTKLTVLPKESPVFSDRSTNISICDDGAGEFVELEQNGQSMTIDPDEWFVIRDAVDEMVVDLKGPTPS